MPTQAPEKGNRCWSVVIRQRSGFRFTRGDSGINARMAKMMFVGGRLGSTLRTSVK
jgi:hypothetical protein